MTQRWDPDTYAAHACFVSELGAPVADLLAPKPGERILDLGCGDGALIQRLGTAGSTEITLVGRHNRPGVGRSSRGNISTYVARKSQRRQRSWPGTNTD